MVYLQGISHQFEINVIYVFYNNFWNYFGKFFNVLGFLLLASKKNGGFTFSICCLLMINIYWFFDLLLFQWSWHIFTAPGIFLMICWSVCNFWKVVFMLFCCSHLTKKFRKKKHTLTCFSLKNHGQSFFLNHLFLQFDSRTNRGFYFCK